MQLAEQINKKWAPVLDHPDLPEIKDAHRRAVTALCLENVEKQFAQDQQGGGLLSEATPISVMGTTTAVGSGAAGGTDAGQVGVDFADPVLISMDGKAIALNSDLHVDINPDLVSQLEKLLGSGAVSVEFKAMKQQPKYEEANF